MEPVENWKVAYEDPQIKVRIDPMEEDGYMIVMDDIQEFIPLPRGCLREVAQADRILGRQILETLLPYHLRKSSVFRGTDLTWDSLLAATAKAYIAEEEKIRKFVGTERSQFL
ncbi:MAG: hypothetical protein KJ879_00140 [Nanoarchaeota archaeon]|nr:hypothetical protein [Nanoarchaeota archaeon]